MVKGLAYNVILGIEWLDRFNPIIDLKFRTILVLGLNTLSYECGALAAVEVCSWKGMVHTARHTGNTMFLCTFNEASDVHVAHRECLIVHDVVGSASCCAAAASKVKEVASLDSRVTQLCNKFVDVFAEPEIPPDRDVTHDIVLEEGAPPKPRVYRKSPAELLEVEVS